MVQGVIKEVISKKQTLLREFDEPFPYDYSDAREREDYFRRALAADFPRFPQYKINGSWESAYYTAKDEYMSKQEELLKKQKLADREARKASALDKKRLAQDRRENVARMWANAVRYAFLGDEVFANESTYENDSNEFYENWNDGLVDFPVVLKDGSQVMFHAHSWLKVNDDYFSKASEWQGMGKEEYDMFSIGLGGTLGESEDENAPEADIYMTIRIYSNPMDMRITHIDISNENISRWGTSKLLNQIAKKKAVSAYKKIKSGVLGN